MKIIAASPYIKQPATRSYREVLRWDGEQFVCHRQFEDDGSFEHGDYFMAGETDLPNALACFAKRVAMQAEYSKSCFRGVAVQTIPQETTSLRLT